MLVQGLQVITPWGVLVAPREKIALQQGQTLRVFLSFNYQYGGTEPFKVTLHGFIGTRQANGTFQSVADGKTAISLPKATTFTPQEASVDIPTSGGFIGIGKTPLGTYDLLVRFDEFPDVYAELSQVVDISSAGADLTGAFGAMMMLVMLGMVMPMITEGMAE